MINKVKYIPSMKLITSEKNIEDLNDKRKTNLTNQKIKWLFDSLKYLYFIKIN